MPKVTQSLDLNCSLKAKQNKNKLLTNSTIRSETEKVLNSKCSNVLYISNTDFSHLIPSVMFSTLMGLSSRERMVCIKDRARVEGRRKRNEGHVTQRQFPNFMVKKWEKRDILQWYLLCCSLPHGFFLFAWDIFCVLQFLKIFNLNFYKPTTHYEFNW